MADPQQTVFISYRRDVSSFVARAIFMNLRQYEYDVFMDVESIDSGQFDTIILNQIAARAHFLVILTPGTLEKCQEADDWLRREIECAIELKRNVVPILANNFRFDDNTRAHLAGALRKLPGYNGVTLSHDYFDAAMERLRTRFLKEPVQGGITPAPRQDAPVVQHKIEVAVRQPAPTKEELLAEDYLNRGGKIAVELPQFPTISAPVEVTQPFLSKEIPAGEQPDREISTIEPEPESKPSTDQEELWNKKGLSNTEAVEDTGIHEIESYQQEETKGIVRVVKSLSQFVLVLIVSSIISLLLLLLIDAVVR